MRRFVFVATLVVATLIATVSPAGAEKFKVNFTGGGTFALLGDGSAALTGDETGDPFDGSYEAASSPPTARCPSQVCASRQRRR